MIKPQDVVLLLKLLANPEHLKWPQAQMSMQLCVSVSEINAGIKRLISAGLLQIAHPLFVNLAGIEKLRQSKQQMDRVYQPVLASCEEFIIYGIKYIFPAQLGEITVGIETSYAAPVMKGYTTLGNDPVPVWPYAEGNQRGMTLAPLYPSVPKSIHQFPDTQFYELLCLVDVLRLGNCREYAKAVELLKERIKA